MKIKLACLAFLSASLLGCRTGLVPRIPHGPAESTVVSAMKPVGDAFTNADIAADTRGCANGIGNPDKKNPLICVSVVDGRIVLNPDPVRVLRKNDAGNSVKIKWRTKTDTGQLHVTLKNAGCVGAIVCPNDHTCFGETNLKFVGNGWCRYTVILSGAAPRDPEIIIEDPGLAGVARDH